jgi:hypothetical protein
MHIFINAGEGDEGGSYITALVCKGKTQKKKQVEMQPWHKDVPMHFQPNVWVDRPTMIRIAEEFAVHHKKEKDGDSPVLLICDNFKPHLNPEK